MMPTDNKQHSRTHFENRPYSLNGVLEGSNYHKVNI